MKEADLARLEERIAAVKERADRVDKNLEGFPQIYALRPDIDRMLVLIDTIRTDHVQRQEFDALRERLVASEKFSSATIAALENKITYLYTAVGIIVAIAIAVTVKTFTG